MVALRPKPGDRTMTIAEKVQQDMVEAMKARAEQKLSTLRMMKTAIKNKEIDKRSPLTDQETIQILSTMIKQRRDSIEQFTKGGRQELADKEAAEIVLIETYMPKAAGEAEIKSAIDSVIAELSAAGTKPTIKDLGTVMKAVMAKFQASGIRVDGKA